MKKIQLEKDTLYVQKINLLRVMVFQVKYIFFQIILLWTGWNNFLIL